MSEHLLAKLCVGDGRLFERAVLLLRELKQVCDPIELLKESVDASDIVYVRMCWAIAGVDSPVWHKLLLRCLDRPRGF